MRSLSNTVVGRRGLAVGGLVLLIGIVGVLLLAPRGSTASATAMPSLVATRGDVKVTVGGVGRVVSGAGDAAQAATASQSTTLADGVYARTTGRVAQVLVAPGRSVVAGQPLALLDDGGVATVGVDQALADLAVAQLELRQKRTSDPLNGTPSTKAERAAAELAVAAARDRLARLLGHPTPADLGTARLELRRAVADLETLRGGTAATRAAAIASARRGVRVARLRLDRLLGGPAPSDVSAAEAELKRAEAELDALRRPSITPSPETLLAARDLVNIARHQLALAIRLGEIEQIRTAQDSLESALDDLAALLRPGPTALRSQLAAAESAVVAAQRRLDRLVGPPDQADVEAARLELARAEAELQLRLAGPGPAALAAAEAAVAAARQKLAQLQGRPPLADLTAARLELRKAQAELTLLRLRGRPGTASEISLAVLKRGVAERRLALARVAESALTIRAPWAGTVTGVLVQPGSLVDLTTAVATVADIGHLAVQVDLSEFDIARVVAGQPAVVRVDALGGQPFRGTVRFAAQVGSSSAGVVTFPVSVAVPGVSGLRPGMNVSVRIVVAERRGVVTVPLDAVTGAEGDTPSVTVVDAQGTERTRRVTLGLASNKVVEIVKGLRVGERLVPPTADVTGE